MLSSSWPRVVDAGYNMVMYLAGSRTFGHVREAVRIDGRSLAGVLAPDAADAPARDLLRCRMSIAKSFQVSARST